MKARLPSRNDKAGLSRAGAAGIAIVRDFVRRIEARGVSVRRESARSHLELYFSTVVNDGFGPCLDGYSGVVDRLFQRVAG